MRPDELERQLRERLDALGPVIFGAWSANAAERKGYPRSTGWFLGGLLGLLGRIIIGVMRQDDYADGEHHASALGPALGSDEGPRYPRTGGRLGKQMSRFQARRAVQLFNEHLRDCPVCDGLESVLCDEGERLNEEASAATSPDADGASRPDQRLGEGHA